MENEIDNLNNGELELDASEVSNAVLKRLIEEVRYEKENKITAYNRLHNRHNRSGSPHPYPRPTPTPTPKPDKPEEDEQQNT